MSRPRIALVSTKRDWHGGEEQVWQLALGLVQRGCECCLLAPHPSELVRRAADTEISGRAFPGRGRRPSSLWTLRRQLKQFRPHVLHCNDAHALTAAGLAAFGLPIPARVAARRVAFPLCNAFQYNYFSDRVICVSEQVAHLCREGGIPECRLRVVHDGVDLRRATGGNRKLVRQQLRIADDQPLILTLARFTAEKGHEDLLAAMPEVLERYPGAVLALAGDGELRPRLTAQAEDLGLNSGVLFLGFREDVRDLLAACDLVVLPSHHEGLGSALVEAMLARRPIVATTAGGIPDLIGSDADGQPPVGLLVPPRDASALSEAIRRALRTPLRMAELAGRAYERARARFTIDRMVDATLAVYQELLPTVEFAAGCPKTTRAA
jgi:glycosyltransferase involved in cell wall biosynthesis